MFNMSEVELEIERAKQAALTRSCRDTQGSADGDSFWSERVLDHPQIFVLHKLLSAAEGDNHSTLAVVVGDCTSSRVGKVCIQR